MIISCSFQFQPFWGVSSWIESFSVEIKVFVWFFVHELWRFDIPSRAGSIEAWLDAFVSHFTCSDKQLDQTPINLREGTVTFKSNFVYLSDNVLICYDSSVEITKRFQWVWASFVKHSQFISYWNVHMEHKGKLFDMAIIPSFVYGPTKKAPKPGYKRTKKL